MAITSRQRLLGAWSGEPVDHVPLCTWCFGVQPPARLRWQREGHDVPYWYSLRMAHIHTLPAPWGLEDDFRRVLAWHSLGVDDVLDVSVPWSVDPDVAWRDWLAPAGEMDPAPVLVRDYQTPSGALSLKKQLFNWNIILSSALDMKKSKTIGKSLSLHFKNGENIYGIKRRILRLPSSKPTKFSAPIFMISAISSMAFIY